MSAWYIAIHGQMLPDYSQNINLVAAARSRGSEDIGNTDGDTEETRGDLPTSHTITISNNTAPGEMPWKPIHQEAAKLTVGSSEVLQYNTIHEP